MVDGPYGNFDAAHVSGFGIIRMDHPFKLRSVVCLSGPVYDIVNILILYVQP